MIQLQYFRLLWFYFFCILVFHSQVAVFCLFCTHQSSRPSTRIGCNLSGLCDVLEVFCSLSASIIIGLHLLSLLTFALSSHCVHLCLFSTPFLALELPFWNLCCAYWKVQLLSFFFPLIFYVSLGFNHFTFSFLVLFGHTMNDCLFFCASFEKNLIFECSIIFS